MTKIYFTITFFIISASSLFGQLESERYFLDVNHFENLHYDFTWIELPDKKTYEDNDKKYLIVDLALLHTPFLGDKEHVIFSKFGFDTELVYFDLEGEFQRITLAKNRDNVKSKYELYEILEYLDWRFGSHTYSNGLYFYENTFIKVVTGFDANANLLVQSQPKR